MLVFGYPTEQQKNKLKPNRFDLQYIVHENGYDRLNAADLGKMITEKIGDQDYEGWLQAFCKRKYNSDFAREMTRSVEVYLQEFQSS